MEIAFSTRELRDQCEQEALAIEAYGKAIAGQLRRRLADIHAADSIFELPTGNPQQTTHGGTDAISIDLCQDAFLVLCSNHKLTPRNTTTNGTDWSRVRRMKVMWIGAKDA